MYDTVLVPTDGSDAANCAIDDAIEVAATYDATVHALYVVDVDAVSLALGAEQLDRTLDVDSDRFPDDLRSKAADATGAVAARARERGLDVVESIEVGTPHDEIARYADEHDVDLIVLGSHGRTGVKRRLLGSVAERVVRTTTAPVLVVDARANDLDGTSEPHEPAEADVSATHD